MHLFPKALADKDLGKVSPISDAVVVPVAHVVTPAAVRRFARFRDRILEQIRKVIHEEDTVHPLR